MVNGAEAGEEQVYRLKLSFEIEKEQTKVTMLGENDLRFSVRCDLC